jgi:hypothetical protein
MANQNLDCLSEECASARAKLEAARNEIIRLCARIEFLKGERDAARAMAIVLGAMAAVMLALGVVLVATIFFGILAAIFFGLGLLFLTLQALFLGLVVRLNGQITDAEAQLDVASKAFQSAVAEVMQNCPSECWGDLVMPTC